MNKKEELIANNLCTFPIVLGTNACENLASKMVSKLENF
jgi:hypothetical protein